MTGPDHDILIVGAGISGISMAAHLQMMCPERSYSIVERRERLGGTWDLFRYPGIRSDSDMHSFGFSFEPWRDEKSIAPGENILAYLHRVVSSRGIDKHIRFGCRVVSAEWKGEEALWHVTIEDAQGWRTESARFLYLGSGYYDYDNPHDAQLPGLSDFAGTVVHPQFWPEELDWNGKRVVVIGSGATAVTIVPAMAERAAHVTMLQRTPTWMAVRPSKDRWAGYLRRLLPEKWAYAIMRQINTRLHSLVFKRARAKPEKVSAFLTRVMQDHLGEKYEERHFKPPYNPWEQRLCLVPDGDLFTTIREGKASVASGHIERIEADGILLKDGTKIPADIIVTATGLRLVLGGKIDVRVDGEKVEWPQRWFYRNCMFSNVPNFAVVFGYLNASWTLRADMTAKYVCRVLAEMKRLDRLVVVPRPPEDREMVEGPPFAFSSGYIQRALPLIPKSEPQLPWKLNMDYFEDVEDMRVRPVNDGVLSFEDPAQRPVEAIGELA